MLIKKSNLREDVEKCLTDPIFDVVKNFSLEKSKLYYAKREKAWANGMFSNNPAAKKEEVIFDFHSLSELGLITTQAHNLYINLTKETFNQCVGWYIQGEKIVVHRKRLKTFDEWLHDGLKDALTMAADCPEDGARQIIERELGKGIYSNTAIHMFAEGVISEEELKRLGAYEKYMFLEERDIEKDIEQAKKALEDIKENNVTVLKLKM